eukprot:gene4628-biopygen8453
MPGRCVSFDGTSRVRRGNARGAAVLPIILVRGRHRGDGRVARVGCPARAHTAQADAHEEVVAAAAGRSGVVGQAPRRVAHSRRRDRVTPVGPKRASPHVAPARGLGHREIAITGGTCHVP